jgi:hypothetical protein
MMEALVCHPLGMSFLLLNLLSAKLSLFAAEHFHCRKLNGDFPESAFASANKERPDTIKVRMQLSRRSRADGAQRGFIKTGVQIVKKETPLGLYKGLGAVLTGIVPKMAIRFTSFEWYKGLLANKETGVVSGQATFLGMWIASRGATASIKAIVVRLGFVWLRRD